MNDAGGGFEEYAARGARRAGAEDMSDRQTRHTINVHLGDGPFHIEDFMHTTSPFVSLRLGHNISVFVSTEAQIDELQAALHTVRLYLLNGELDVGSGAEGRP